MTDPHDEELRFRLRTAAEEHRPDRDAMLAGIERRRSPGREGGAHRFSAAVLSPAGPLSSGRTGARRLGPMAAAAAIVTVVVLSVGGTWLVVDPIGGDTTSNAANAPAPPGALPSAPLTTGAPSVSPSAAPSSASPEPTPTRARPSTRAPQSSAPPSASLPPIETVPGGSTPVRGWLWSDGEVDPNSNANWSQSNVTLKNTAEVTALDVTIRVALTAEVRTTGSWSSVSNDKIDKDVREQAGWLYYRFRLKEGVTLAPGSYVFAGQFNHATNGRDPGKDAYLASASAGDNDLEVHGTF